MSKRSAVRKGKPRFAPAATDRRRPERPTTDAEHPYEDLVESLDGIVWEIDPKDFRFKFVSEQCEPLLGYSRERWLNELTWQELIHPDDLDEVLKTCQKAIKERRNHTLEFRVLAADGSVRWMRDIATVISSNSHVSSVRGVLLDISEPRRRQDLLEQTAKALEDQSAVLQSVLDCMSEGVAVVDENGKFLVFNPAGERIIGLGATDTSPDEWPDTYGAFYPDAVTPFPAGDLPLVRAMTGEEVDDVEMFIRNPRVPNGAYLSVSARPLRDGEGNPHGAVGMFHDITERKQAEEALRESEGTWRALLDAIAESVLLIEPEGRIVALNEVAARRLGKRVDEVIDTNVFDLLPPEAAAARKARAEAVVSSGKPLRFDDERGGRWFDNSVNPVFDSHGRVSRLAIYANDITERRRVEEALREAHDELEARVEERTADLRENEERLRAFANAVPDIAVILDSSGLYVETWAPPATADLLYVEADELKGRRLHDVLPKVHADRFLSVVRKTIRTKEPQIFEYALDVQAGERWFEGRTAPLNRPGDPQMAVWVAHDITQRKRAEEALRASEARSKAMLDAIPDLMFRVSRDGEYLDFKADDPSELFTSSPETIIGSNVRDALPPEVVDEILRCIEKALDSGATQTLEYQLAMAQGVKDYEARLAPCGADEVIAIVRDISDSKRAEEALRLTVEGTSSVVGEEFFTTAVKHLAAALGVRYAFIAELVDVTAGSVRLLSFWTGTEHGENFEYPVEGTPCEQVVGKKVAYYPAGVQKLFPADQWLKDFEVESYLAIPLFDSAGAPIGHLGVMHDQRMDNVEPAEPILRIFAARAASELERKRAEELAALQERMRLANELHDATAQTLIGIVLQLDLAERVMRTDAGAGRSELDHARQMAHEGLEEVRRSILALRPLALERMSLSEAVTHEIEALVNDGLNVKIAVSGAPVPVVEEVQTAFSRIAGEAVANIRKHAKATAVDAKLEYGEKTLKLSIADDGVGFAATTSDSSAGAGGLGLTTMRERARAVGGMLRVRSSPGRGTRVSAHVPYSGASALGPAPQPKAAPQADSSSQIRVLVADDHAVVRHGISATLAEAPDIDVVAEAADGAEALTKARRLRPDVVVADVRMPQLGGIELAAALREQELASQVIMLSAYSEGALIAEAMRAGAQGYLLKETSGPELIDAVRAVHRGEIVLQPTAAGEFARRVRDVGEAGFVERLTPRQREVLRLVARGLRNKEIARKLTISEPTVKYHMMHIFEKLGVGGRTEAVGKATELGILTPP